MVALCGIVWRCRYTTYIGSRALPRTAAEKQGEFRSCLCMGVTGVHTFPRSVSFALALEGDLLPPTENPAAWGSLTQRQGHIDIPSTVLECSPLLGSMYSTVSHASPSILRPTGFGCPPGPPHSTCRENADAADDRGPRNHDAVQSNACRCL